jgi:ABC-2 type transport system permease protein
MKAFSTILKTESRLVLRGIDTWFFGVLQPIVVAVLIGIIMGGSNPAYEGANYSIIQQAFGAVISIAICATGLMGLPLTIADYRHRKILKRYQVTPISPALILCVQCIINIVVSLIALLCVYAVCALFFGYKMIGGGAVFLLAYSLVTIAIYGIGMMLASIAPNMKTANLLCTLIYFPMIFLSGAIIPYEVMPVGLQKVMNFLPLTQGIKLLKGASLGFPLENMLFQTIVMAALAVICIFISIRSFKWE